MRSCHLLQCGWTLRDYASEISRRHIPYDFTHMWDIKVKWNQSKHIADENKVLVTRGEGYWERVRWVKGPNNCMMIDGKLFVVGTTVAYIQKMKHYVVHIKLIQCYKPGFLQILKIFLRSLKTFIILQYIYINSFSKSFSNLKLEFSKVR